LCVSKTVPSVDIGM